jgi:hypothetical protein
MPRVLTAEAEERLRELPGWAQSAPEHKALCQVFAKEGERQRAAAREIRDGMIAAHANALTLPLWETLLKLTVNPSGATVLERRSRVLAALAAAPADPSGLTFNERLTAFIGPGWTMEEEGLTLHFTVPYPPGSPEFQLAKRVIERERPAHLAVIVDSSQGFILDLSELDEETFGGN